MVFFQYESCRVFYGSDTDTMKRLECDIQMRIFPLTLILASVKLILFA